MCILAGQEEVPTDGSASKSSCTGQVALKGGAVVLFTVHQAGLQFSCFPVVLEPDTPLQRALRSRKHAPAKAVVQRLKTPALELGRPGSKPGWIPGGCHSSNLSF